MTHSKCIKMILFLVVSLLLSVGCGFRLKPNTGSRIVGGSNVDICDYPYAVSVQHLNFHACGGSIVATKWILTAAHCIQFPVTVKSITVVVDTSNLNDGGETYSVESLIPHESYDSKTYSSDIALIKLTKPITYSKCVKMISLNPNYIKFTAAVSVGWGYVKHNGGKISSVLQVLKMTTITSIKCKLYLNIVKASHICAKATTSGGVCNGDSGGPLVADNQQIGIVSFGLNPCGSNAPDSFTRISSYAAWINRTINNN